MDQNAQRQVTDEKKSLVFVSFTVLLLYISVEWCVCVYAHTLGVKVYIYMFLQFTFVVGVKVYMYVFIYIQCTFLLI